METHNSAVGVAASIGLPIMQRGNQNPVVMTCWVYGRATGLNLQGRNAIGFM